MFIVRDGKKIELTSEELANASMEFDRICYAEDVDAALSAEKLGITREELDSMNDEIVKRYEQLMEENDGWQNMVLDAALYVMREHGKAEVTR